MAYKQRLLAEKHLISRQQLKGMEVGESVFLFICNVQSLDHNLQICSQYRQQTSYITTPFFLAAPQPNTD